MPMTMEIAAIWQEFHRELRSFILARTRDPHEADDILQEAFVRIIRGFDRVSGSDNMHSYLYGIVRNAINDHYRNRPLHMPVEDESLSIEEEQALNMTIAQSCIRPLINRLPEHYREALLLTEFYGVAQTELAAKMGISYSGAKSRVQRGKEKLKKLILECCAYQSDAYGNLAGEHRNCNCGD